MMQDMELLEQFGLYLPGRTVVNAISASQDTQICFFLAKEILALNGTAYLGGGRRPWVDIESGQIDQHLMKLGQAVAFPHIYISLDGSPQDQDTDDQTANSIWGMATISIEAVSDYGGSWAAMKNEAEIMVDYAIRALTDPITFGARFAPDLGMRTMPNLNSREKVQIYPFDNATFALAKATLQFLRTDERSNNP
jgi:hypothetical protein